MKQLECDDGYELILDNGPIQVFGTLSSVYGDSLAIHELFGFFSPSANKFCRMCLAHRNEINFNFDESYFTLRDIEGHDGHAEIASAMRNGDPSTGVN